MSSQWPMTLIGEVLTQVWREEAVNPSRDYRLLGARWYGGGLFAKDRKSGQEIRADSVYRVEASDFVYNRLFAWKGSFAVASPEADGAYVSNEFPCFVAQRDRLDPMFLWWYFRREGAWAQALGLSTGATPTSRNRLKEALFLNMQIPLPPLAEQRRVVTRIEELAAQIHEARTLRQQAAEEAEAFIRAGPESAFQKLAAKHETRTVREICISVTDGDHNTPYFADNGVRFIFVGNVSSGILHFENAKRVSPAYFKTLKPQRVPKRGDVLYSAVGATLGVPALVDTDEPFCFQRHVAILKPNRERIVPQFFFHMLCSRTVFEKAWSSTTGSAQPTVPLRAIRQLPIPVPALSEQRRIAEEMDALQAEVDAVKRLQAETAAELDALLPSILDRAFRGEL